MGNQNLLPISTILRLARDRGIFLGNGKAENRIAYFVKTGLLPHAVRRKNPATGKIEAYFPISILTKIEDINNLKKNGTSVHKLANGYSSSDFLSTSNDQGLKTDVKFLVGTLIL